MGRSQCLGAVLVTPAFCLTTGLICACINQLLKETPTNKIGADNAYEVNIWDIRPDPIYGTGAIVDFAAVPVPIIYKVGGKWNTYEIYAKGAQMTVKLNGTVTVGVQDSKFPAGPFALQFGAGVKGVTGGPIKWRSVQIRPL